MGTQIVRHGGAGTVEIPEELLKQANLAVGDSVQWRLTPSGAIELQSPYDAGTLATSPEEYEAWKQEEIEAGIAEHEAGQWVDGERVKEWVRSLGTSRRLPMPE